MDDLEIGSEFFADFDGLLPFPEERKPVSPAQEKLEAKLDEYDFDLTQNIHRLKNYVINRLIEDSTVSDVKVRMRALESLGKLSGMELFTERSELTVKHDPNVVTNLLRARLENILDTHQRAPLVIENAANNG